MPVQGNLRDFGVHDLFLLVDMGRKTGVLRVRSLPPRIDATIWLRAGNIVYAWMSDRPSRIEELLHASGRVSSLDLEHARRFAVDGASPIDVLVRAGAVSQREVDRQAREHIERAVFEILSWKEGTFSFEDRAPETLQPPTGVMLDTESVLMESARRSDEWSRVADLVPNEAAVPALAEAPVAHGPSIDLLPAEWAVLAAIDGQRNVRAIASELTQATSDVAKAIFTLARIGLVQVRRA